MEEHIRYNINKNEYPWILIESYFKDEYLKQLIRHQLESYNYFVKTQIENTIEMFNPIHIASEHDYIKEFNIYRLEINIIFENFNIHRPQVYENNGATKIMFPHEARLRNFTYAGSMTVDLNITYIVRNGEQYSNTITYNRILKNIHIGKMPIMLRSDICVLNQYKHLDSTQTGECKMDPGGYFIINGSEKTCLGQERAAENQVYCFNIEKNNTKWSWIAEMKSIPDWKCISPKQINILLSTKDNGFGKSLYLQIPRLKNPIPLFIIFRAFNIISDLDICKIILLNVENKEYKKLLYALKASIVDANNYLTYDSAIKYIVSNVIYTPLNVDKETGYKRRLEFANEVINNDIFPHCKTNNQKIYMLGYMTNQLLKTSFGWIQESDRDSYINKRIDLTGSLLNNLFRNYLNKLVKDMQKLIIREINSGSWKSSEDYTNIISNTNIYKIIKSTTIENGIKRALSTGDFGIKQINSNKVGVAQVLNRLTYISTLSHLRRINTPIDKSGKLIPPRQLHNSSWGFLCCAESPEGASVGVVKNLSYMTHITIPSNSTALYDYILPLITSLDNIIHNNIEYIDDKVKIFINGCWVGITEKPIELYNNLKSKKYKGIINIYTSIIFNFKTKEIKICNDAGRLLRPLFRVINNKLLCNHDIISRVKSGELSWYDTLYEAKIDNTIIEYIDSYEQNFAMIAMEPSFLINNNKNDQIFKYTHCEIHPSTIFGIVASCIPFPEHNQAPRNTYQCLDPNTPIIMADNTFKFIKDVKIGDYVKTFNPISFNITDTKIIYQYVRENTKKCFRITTFSGKYINATFDHQLMTYSGWKQIQNINVTDDLLAIKPTLSYQSNISNKFYILKINKNTNRLFTNDNLIIYSTDKNIHILARIFGYIKSNFKIINNNLYITFCNNQSYELFNNDVSTIGFNISSFKKYQKNTIILPYYHSFYKYLQLIYLFQINIPFWIINGSNLVKREFLAAFMTNYINFIEFNDNFNIIFNTSFNFYNDSVIYDILNNLKIKHYYFNIKNNYLLFKKKKQIWKMYFSDYINNIGFRYNTNISIKSSIINEFTNNIDFIDNNIIDKYYFEQFINKCKSYNNTIFIPIKSINEIYLSFISDITTESENHSFIIANGFMSHNCAMAKQSLGVYVTNFDNRMDKTSYVLTYPMRPLVDTRLMNIIKMNNIPSGEQVIVAIMSHTGYNQEDSILFNKGSIDRGLFLATIYHTEKDEDKKLYGNEEIRCKPDKSKTKNIKFANYDKVNQHGVIPENTLVEDRDVIIAKVVPIKDSKNDFTKIIKYTDESHIYRTHEPTYIDKNYIECNGDGYNFCKVRLRNFRKPVIGDKFCLTNDHFILTTDGWIPIFEVSLKHKVATLVNGNTLVYQNPIHIQSYECNEELYEINTNQVSLKVTKNHRMWVGNRNGENYKIKTAEECYGKKWCYMKNCENWVPDFNSDYPKELKLNQDKTEATHFIIYDEKGNIKYELDIDEWIKFFGIWIAEGWAHNSYGISVASFKDRVKIVLDSVAKNLGWKWRISNVYNKITDKTYENANYTLKDKDIVKYMITYSVGAVNKYLPEWCWYLTKKQSLLLLTSMELADGHIMANGTVRYDTSSIQLANDYQRLSLHAGCSANKYLKEIAGNKSYSHTYDYTFRHTVDSWRLTRIISQNHPKVNKYRIQKSGENSSDRFINYNGMVYCCTVPNDGIIYVQRNNKPVWCGNSSRHGQKGTIGNIIPEKDMPFTDEGIRPDIIINPHAIPSRMTIAQLKETLLGKVLLQLGLFGDGTSFGKFNISDIADKLQTLGYESKGNELLYNAMTGQQLQCSIFIGPVFYQRLKHMVNDKQHSRAIGPMVNLTRQPAEGRVRDGGLRFGEMERDAMVSHGASRFTKGRLYDQSDAYSVHICGKCGMIASFNNKQNIHICNTCENRTDFKYVEIPYACKLLFQELLTMNIAPRIITE